MKTSKPLCLRHSRLLAFLATMTFVCPSCTKSQDNSYPQTKFQPQQWYLAKKSPPTYFPKGVPTNHSIENSNGYWIFSGDQAGTQYYIPSESDSSRDLVAQAMSQMTPEQEQKLKKGESSGRFSWEKLAGRVLRGTGNGLMEIDREMKRRQNPFPENGGFVR